MKPILILAAAFTLSGNIAFGQVTAESVANDLVAQGYTRVEVRQGPTQLKVEAIQGTEKLEVIYDIATGKPLKTENETASARDRSKTGVQIRDSARDFVRVVQGGSDSGKSVGEDRDDDKSDRDDRSDDDDHDSDDDDHDSNDNDHDSDDDDHDNDDHDSDHDSGDDS